MLELMSLQQWAAVFSIALSALALLPKVRRVFINLWKRSFGRTYALLEEHIRSEEDSLEEIKKELKPNGGQSLRDAVDGIVNRLNEVDALARAQLNIQKIAICRTDSQGHLIQINKYYARLTGWTFEEVKGEGWVNAIAPVDRRRVQEDWEAAVEEGREYHDDIHFIRPDGKEFLTHVNVYRELDREGKIRGWLAIIIPTENFND
jgi:PAS domain S-box-containing protein